MALVEAVVAMGILALGIAAVLSALARANAITTLCSHRLAVLAACRAAIEQARSAGRFVLPSGVASNSAQIILSGPADDPARQMKALRIVTMRATDDPIRTDVEVAVTWHFGGREYREVIAASVYDKDADLMPSVEFGSLAGLININPNNSPDSEFELETESGSVITRDDLVDVFAGYTGQARRIRVRPKGADTQNGLVLNGQPYVLVNNLRYEIASQEMTVNLFNDHVTSKGKAVGRWWIDVRAASAEVRELK